MKLDFGLDLQTIAPSSFERPDAFYRAAIERISGQFSTVWFGDHLQIGSQPVLECWTTISYLAAQFPALRFGTYVVANEFRNPALVAKMAASLHALTGGRFVLGIGAGSHPAEHRAYGYPFPALPERIQRLEESIGLIRAMWSGDGATFSGRYYSTADAYCVPSPSPHTPILIGSSGGQGMRLAAKLADGWNSGGLAQPYLRRLTELRRHCLEVGRDPTEIWLTCSVVARLGAPARSANDDETGVLGPTADQAVEQLAELAELGVEHVSVLFEELDTIDAFCSEVAPQFC